MSFSFGKIFERFGLGYVDRVASAVASRGGGSLPGAIRSAAKKVLRVRPWGFIARFTSNIRDGVTFNSFWYGTKKRQGPGRGVQPARGREVPFDAEGLARELQEEAAKDFERRDRAS